MVCLKRLGELECDINLARDQARSELEPNETND